MTGYTLEWIANDLGITKRGIQKWMYKGLFADLPPTPFKGRHTAYSRDFLRRARAIKAELETWPHGPLENIRDRLIRDPEDDE